jgi:AraC-like DNA-binding protein
MSHLTRRFKGAFGITPGAYRRAVLPGAAPRLAALPGRVRPA